MTNNLVSRILKLALVGFGATILSTGIFDYLNYNSMNKQEKIEHLQKLLNFYEKDSMAGILGPQLGGMYTAHYHRARIGIQNEMNKLRNK